MFCLSILLTKEADNSENQFAVNDSEIRALAKISYC